MIPPQKRRVGGCPFHHDDSDVSCLDESQQTIVLTKMRTASPQRFCQIGSELIPIRQIIHNTKSTIRTHKRKINVGLHGK